MLVYRSFPALLSRSNEDGANIKVDSNFVGGSRIYRLAGEDIAEYVTRQQTLDREERAAWRVTQKRQVEIRIAELQAEDKKRADEIQIAEIEAQAKDKKRADEIHMAERADEIKIQIAKIKAVKEQAKTEADKELKIKEMELQAQQSQATTSSATTPPPLNKATILYRREGRIRQLPATL